MSALGPLGRRWRAVHGQASTWVPPPVPTVVVVPHPDDEVLMFGGLIARQRAAGAGVSIVALTDGEAVYPSLDACDVADRRRREQLAALACLGVEPSAVVRLGIADGGVAAVEDHLTAVLVDLAAGHGLVLAPWTGDHHCDHEAAGRAAALAGRAVGATVAFGLFWTWHHVAPASVAPCDMRRVALVDESRECRRRAVRQHESQITDCIHEPLLTPADLEPSTWDDEYYLAGPCR